MATTDQYPQTNPPSIADSPYPYNFKDFAHASRLYRDGYYKYAPKPKWIYHVVFSIDPTALKGGALFDYRKLQVVNMLAKNVELPKFKMNVEKFNQYNRSKLVQTKINYEPITIVLHDTNDGITTKLWNYYYMYYFYDSKHSSLGSNLLGATLGNVLGNVGSLFFSMIPNAYGHNAYGPSLAYRYGLDSDWSNPFFRSIAVYQMSRHQYQSYMFVNPVITSWNHATLDQTDGSGMCEHTMTIEYETVFYKTGGTGDDNPLGFSGDIYDHLTSPLGPGPNFKESTSAADIVGGVEGLVGGVLGGSLGSFTGLMQTGATVYGLVNSISNYNSKNDQGMGENAVEVLGGSVGINGVSNTAFPKSDSQAPEPNLILNSTNTNSAIPATRNSSEIPADSEFADAYTFKNVYEPMQLRNGATPEEAQTNWNNLSATDKGPYISYAAQQANK